MPFQDVIRLVGEAWDTEAVPWHEHGADEISGEFGDIVIAGDFFSSNWDGALPADLSGGKDATAANGFYFDTSEGSVQFRGDMWVGGALGVDGTITLSSTGALRSDNYAAGTAGLQILGTGDAEFNAVTARGALIALAGSNLPATHITAGTIASQQITLSGTSQLHIEIAAGQDVQLGKVGPSPSSHAGLSLSEADYNNIFLRRTTDGVVFFRVNSGGTHSIDFDTASGVLAIKGNINAGTITGTAFRTAATGTRLEIDQSQIERIRFYDVTAGQVGYIGYDAANTRLIITSEGFPAARDIAVRSENNTIIHAKGAIVLDAGGLDGPYISLAKNGSLTNPAIAWDPGEGFYKVSAGVIAIASSGGQAMQFGTAVTSVLIRDNTTGSAANGFVNSLSGVLGRSTSARRYKSRITYNVDYLADIDLRPAKFYRKDDHRWFYGLIADDLVDQDSLLGDYDENGEVENYDDREVIAVLAAKVNRLEAEIAQLKEAA